jgi:hypothetical protein
VAGIDKESEKLSPEVREFLVSYGGKVRRRQVDFIYHRKLSTPASQILSGCYALIWTHVHNKNGISRFVSEMKSYIVGERYDTKLLSFTFDRMYDSGPLKL